MNKKPLNHKREMSPFFYGNKLYEFAHKKLPPEDRLRMKKMIESDRDSKHEIGSVLLSLEYLKKLAEVKLQVKEEEHEKLGRRGRWAHALNLIIFACLTFVFSISGYYLLVYFNFRALN